MKRGPWSNRTLVFQSYLPPGTPEICCLYPCTVCGRSMDICCSSMEYTGLDRMKAIAVWARLRTPAARRPCDGRERPGAFAPSGLNGCVPTCRKSELYYRRGSCGVCFYAQSAQFQRGQTVSNTLKRPQLIAHPNKHTPPWRSCNRPSRAWCSWILASKTLKLLQDSGTHPVALPPRPISPAHLEESKSVRRVQGQRPFGGS